MPGLTDTILDQHRKSPRDREPKPAHVLLGPSAARFVLPLIASLEPDAMPDLGVWAWTDRAASASALDEVAELLEVARGLRISVSPAVAGACETTFRESVAAPCRLVVTCGMPDVALGALGVLACATSPLEAAALLRGRSSFAFQQRRVQVDMRGRPMVGIDGSDAALEMLRRQPPARWTDAWLECVGAGVSALPIASRIAFAHLARLAGAAGVLFPSDESTRETLRAWNRDSDWRELRGPDEAGTDAIELDLGSLEPLVTPWDDLVLARGLHHVVGRPVRGVVVGPLADETAIATFASLLEGTRVASGVEVVVAPGTPGMRDALASSGVVLTLESAGVRVFDPAGPWEPPRGGWARGTWLGVGLSRTMRESLPGVLAASIPTCALAARAGTLTDPRELSKTDLPPASPRSAHPRVAPSPAAPADVAPTENGTAVRLSPVRGSLRAVVWLEVDDDCPAERVLPRGDRGRRDSGARDPSVLFPSIARDDAWFASASRLVLMAGRSFGRGGEFDEAAWALARSGVRAVLARSLDPSAVRSLAYAGVLPLESERRSARDLATVGDEIEIPSLPEAVEPGLPVSVRNLTRGVQDTLRHGLDGRLVSIWRSGGLLAPRGGD
jgi:aconitate hydratase